MCRGVAWAELTTEGTFVVRIQSGMPDKKEYRSITHWLMMQVLYFFYLTDTDQSGMREAFRLCNGDEERKQI